MPFVVPWPRSTSESELSVQLRDWAVHHCRTICALPNRWGADAGRAVSTTIQGRGPMRPVDAGARSRTCTTRPYASRAVEVRFVLFAVVLCPTLLISENAAMHSRVKRDAIARVRAEHTSTPSIHVCHHGGRVDECVF